MIGSVKLALRIAAAIAALYGGLSMPRAGASELPVLEEQAMQRAVARVADSVVRIETVGGLDRVGDLLIGTGPTTGLIVSDDGYIISSAFNFIQKPASILVTLPDGARAPARLVASDKNRMLVLLKVNPPAPLKTPEAVPAADMRVGQWAIAVGRVFDLGQVNLSVGIVSALDRVWGKAVQTDAKISPANYGGPLVDISGRVLGVLAPLSPQKNDDVAGVEWYDSGIGFAVPLAHILEVLPRLKQGQDLEPGMLGVSLKGADMFSEPAAIAACRVKSPAHQAGFKAGDVIVEAGGKKITRQAELKHQINPRYAGDKLKLVVMRKEERIEREVELAAKLEPYVFPFLGVLPTRPVDGKPAGIVVRYVYPDSPASRAGLEAGHEIKTIDGQPVTGLAGALELVRQHLPEEKLRVEIVEGEKARALEISLARLPEQLPGPLPAAHAAPPAPPADVPQTGAVSIKVPEFENECLAYVPDNYNPAINYGVVIWLHGSGGFKQQELIDRWKDLCRARDLILLAPKAADPARWQPTEAEFVRRALDQLLESYKVDRNRVVAHGYEGGGVLAYLLAFGNLDVIRAVAAVDAPLPMSIQPPETDPVVPLAVFATSANKASFTPLVKAGLKRLADLKYPVTVIDVGEQGRYLTPGELVDLGRWIDALDRF